MNSGHEDNKDNKYLLRVFRVPNTVLIFHYLIGLSHKSHKVDLMVPLVFLVYTWGNSQKDKALAKHLLARTHTQVSFTSKQYSALLLNQKEKHSIIESTD